MIEPVVELWPKSAHNIFTGRGGLPKLLRLAVEMFILPGRESNFESAREIGKAVKRSATFVVFAPHGRFREIMVAVSARIVAFAVKRNVFGRGKRRSMKAVRRAEGPPHPKEGLAHLPILGEEIVSLVQPDTMQWQSARYSLEKIVYQTFCRLWPIR